MAAERDAAAWRVAVVGSGAWSRVHLAALSECSGVADVTLVGRNRQSLTELAHAFPIVTQTATDLQQALDDPSVALVDVVLPHHLHAETTLRALEADKHVLCEKPGSLCVEDFDRIVTTATSHRRRALVVMNQLYHGMHREVLRVIQSGDLGRPFLLVENAFSHHSANYHDGSTWRTRRAVAGGGVLIDGGFHMVYKHLNWLDALGTPSWVSADAAQLAVDAEGKGIAELGEDFVAYTVGYDAPLRISASHAWTLAADVAHARQHFLAGTDATLEMTGGDASPLVLHRPDGSTPIDVPSGPTRPTETLKACLTDYIDALRTGRDPELGSTALARRTLEVILAVYASGERGQRIALDC